MHHFVACTSSISWDIILFSHIQYKTANITCFVWEVLPKSFESWPSHGNACAHLSQLESSPRLWTYNMGRTKEVRGPVQHVYRWHWHLVASSKAHWWCGSLPILSWRPVVTLNGISSLSCWDAPPPGAPSPSDRKGRLRSTDLFGGLGRPSTHITPWGRWIHEVQTQFHNFTSRFSNRDPEPRSLLAHPQILVWVTSERRVPTLVATSGSHSLN